MAKILLQNVRLIDPNSRHHKGQVSILIEEGIIREIRGGDFSVDDNTELIQAPGLHVSPGWADVHVQISDPGYEYKESLLDLGEAAVKGGFTALLAYPNTYPVIDNAHMVESIRQRAKSLPVDVWLCGSITQQSAGKELAEMYDMYHHGAVAFSDGTHPLQHAGLIQRALLYTQSFKGLLIQYPTDGNLSDRGQMHEGVVSARLGMKGIPSVAEGMGLMRDLRLQSYTGGKIHFHPLTTAESIQEAAEARKKDSNISLGTNVSYIASFDHQLSDYDTNFKLSPPLRNEEEVNAIISAIKKGYITVLGSGHQAQGLEEKKLQFEQAENGVLGLQTAFSLAYQYLVKAGHIDLSHLVELMSIEPRKLLGQPVIRLEEGETANISLFQPENSWSLNATDIPSRAKNSPYIGQELESKVFGIVHKGSFRPA